VDRTSPSDDGDRATFDAAGAMLVDGIDAALGPWVEACVVGIYRAWAGDVPDHIAAEARAAGEAARQEVVPRLRALMSTDIDDQRATPLALVRDAVRFATAVLASAGVPAVVRDDIDEQLFPDDHYGLMPATLAELDPSLVEVAITWGAAKAWLHRRRHAANPSTEH
jgi:hypothetical protein